MTLQGLVYDFSWNKFLASTSDAFDHESGVI